MKYILVLIAFLIILPYVDSYKQLKRSSSLGAISTKKQVVNKQKYALYDIYLYEKKAYENRYAVLNKQKYSLDDTYLYQKKSQEKHYNKWIIDMYGRSNALDYKKQYHMSDYNNTCELVGF